MTDPLLPALVRAPEPSWGERMVDSMVRLVHPRMAVDRAKFRRNEWAVREHLRVMKNDESYREAYLAMMRARGYAATKKGRTNGPWNAAAGHADFHNQDLPTMREYARELERDDSIGSGLIKTFVSRVVSTSLRPQAQTQDRDLNNRLEEVFTERMDHLFPQEGTCWGAAIRTIFRRQLADGDHVVKATIIKPGEPVWFEMIEGERMAKPASTGDRLPKGHTLHDGVERDAAGRITHYWLKKSHPGSVTPGQKIEINDYARVPKGVARHCKNPTRANESRTPSFFHAILQDVKDLDLLLLASLKRTQIAACLSVFIESEEDMDNLMSATAEEYHYELDQTIQPGMIFKLAPNEKIGTVVPNFPVPELVPFVILLACRIGAAVGIHWELVLRDFSKDTYSSSRSAELSSRPTFREYGHDFGHVLSWIWRRVLQDARLRGDPRLAGVTNADIARVRWQGDGQEWVDPLKGGQAKVLARGLGLETYIDQCVELGYDWNEQMDKIQRIQEECNARGFSEAVFMRLAFGDGIKVKGGPNKSASDEDADDEEDGDDGEE